MRLASACRQVWQAAGWNDMAARWLRGMLPCILPGACLGAVFARIPACSLQCSVWLGGVGGASSLAGAWGGTLQGAPGLARAACRQGSESRHPCLVRGPGGSLPQGSPGRCTPCELPSCRLAGARWSRAPGSGSALLRCGLSGGLSAGHRPCPARRRAAPAACADPRACGSRAAGCWSVRRAWLTDVFEPLPAPAAGSCGGCGAGLSWWIAGTSSPRRLTCCWLPPPPPQSAGARAAGGPEDLCHQSEASPPYHHQMSNATSRLTSPAASAVPPLRAQQPRGGRGARDLPPQALVAVLGGVSQSHRITHASRHRRRRRPPGAPWQARAGGAAPARLGLAAPRQGPPQRRRLSGSCATSWLAKQQR